MRTKRGFLLFLLLVIGLAASLTLWQLPAILKAIPSRYVARLPETLQAVGEREHVAQLPTVAAPAGTDPLLQLAARPGEKAVPAAPTPTDLPSFAPPPAGELANHSQATPTPPPPPTATPLPTPTQVPIPAAARLENIHHRFQEWNNCGPATLAMSLSYFGLNLGQKDTAAVLKPNPEDRNVSPAEMAAYVRNYTDVLAITRQNGDLYTLRRLLSEGIPVIIELGIEPPGDYAWLGWYGHYLLPVAYDDAYQQFWVYDSWFGTSEVPLENATSDGRILSYADLDAGWRDFNRTYIALYRPEQANTLAGILGPNLDDATMWQNALARAQDELTAEPENAYLWFNLGSIYNALAQYDLAALAFDQARNIGLPWRMLWYQFGPYEAYYQVGRYEDVRLLADVTLQDRPYFEEAYYYRALAAAALGDLRSARADLQRAIDFNPNFAPAGEALANLGS